MNLKNKTVFITGGSSGLGFSLVKAFLEKGAKIVTNGRSKESVKNLHELNHKNLTAHILDISDSKQVSTIFQKYPNIDILINNAGVWYEGEVGELSYSKIKDTIGANLMGMIFCTDQVIPHMKEKSKGLIINIISTSGLKARGGQSVYVASKFGARGFTDALRDEVIDYGIRVVGVYPGGMNTPFYEKRNLNKDVDSWMDTDDIAKSVIHLIENDQTLSIDQIVLNRKK